MIVAITIAIIVLHAPTSVMGQQRCQLLPCDVGEPGRTQHWTIDPSDNHHITQEPSGQCMDVEGYGTTDQAGVATWPCHPWDKDPAHQNQGWKWQSDDTFISTLSGRCVDTPDPAAEHGRVWIYHCDGSQRQKWKYNITDSTIRHVQSGLCLDCGTTTPPVNPCSKAPGKDLPFCDLTKTLEQRVADLVGRLTTQEKMGLFANTASGVNRLNIPQYEWWSEALHGVADSPGVSFLLPTLVATSFPQVITTVSSFDRELYRSIATAISTEARAFANIGHAGLTFWAPNLNIFRDPRWGRGQETPGEDPKLTSEYVFNFISGMQYGEDPNYLKVSACCKHYAAYSLEDWKGMDRYHFDAVVNAQDMADTYLPAFQTCVQRAKASSVMCSYNSINGIPSCANKKMLTDTIRGEWGFQGYITGDCGAVDCVQTTHNYTTNPDDTCLDVLVAGTDIDCGSFLGAHLPDAVAHGRVPMTEVDEAITNLFMVQYRLGLFDPPERQPYRQISPNDVNTPLHQQLALSAAREGLVLLKNDNNTLPLSRFKMPTIAVVGPNADADNTMQGNYYGSAPYLITPRGGFAKYGTVAYVQGCDISGNNTDSFGDAATAASQADVTIIVIGIDQSIESEGKDRIDITLPGVQDKFVSFVAAAARGPVVVVVMSGSSVDLSAIKNNKKVNSIIWAGYPGQSGGQAIAETVFGDNAPAGRLPITFYRGDYASYTFLDMAMRPSKTSGNPGRTYRFFTGTPVYEFGYGLSYTTFEYDWSGMKHWKTYNRATRTVSMNELVQQGAVSCNVTNTGNIASDTSVLVFLVPPNPGKDGQPLKYLADFTRINLQAGESKIVTFPMTPSLFELADANGEYQMIPGKWRMIIDDIALTVTVPHASPTTRVTYDQHAHTHIDGVLAP